MLQRSLRGGRYTQLKLLASNHVFSSANRSLVSFLTSHPALTTRRTFSVTLPTMTATVIDGTAIAKGVREKLNAQIKQAQELNPRFKPTLRIIQGNDLSE